MKIYTMGYYENGWFVGSGRKITQDDMDAIARYMDDDIRERLHREMAPCDPEDFIRAYLEEDPDFRSCLEEVFQWSDEDDEDEAGIEAEAEDDAEDTQLSEDFVAGLLKATSDGEAAMTLYDETTARDDLEMFRQDGWAIPKGLTPELMAEIWNGMVLGNNEIVITPDGKRVPRYTQMTDQQIANVIRDAGTWDEVEDLVEYVDDRYLNMDKDADGTYQGNWEYKVEDWCDKNR